MCGLLRDFLVEAGDGFGHVFDAELLKNGFAPGFAEAAQGDWIEQ
jgi:hypothetical protein